MLAAVAGAILAAAIGAAEPEAPQQPEHPAAHVWRAINACVSAGGTAIISPAGGQMARFECALPDDEGDKGEKKD